MYYILLTFIRSWAFGLAPLWAVQDHAAMNTHVHGSFLGGIYLGVDLLGHM